MKGPSILLIFGILLIAGSFSYEFLIAPDSNQSTTSTSQTKPSAPNVKKYDILTYVPADTLLFFGGLEPTRFSDMLKVTMPEENWATQIDWSTSDESSSPASPALSMLKSMLIEYKKVLKDSDQAAQALGVNEQFDGAFYTVGALPVLRFSLANSEAFKVFLDRAEHEVEIKHGQEQLGELKLRAYKFNPDAKTPELIITIHDNYAIITIALPETNRNALLEQAIGIEKPADSLADKNDLRELKEKYSFHPGYIGFINHVEIAKGLTNPQSNQFGKMIDNFIKTNLGKESIPTDGTPPGHSPKHPREHPLATIQTPACQKELVDIVKHWPRSALGYTKVAVERQPMELKTVGVLEIHDKELLNDLKNLRGHIPSHLSNINHEIIFGLGLGFNMDALLPFLTKTFQSILQTPYECAPLQDMKQQLAASNGTAALGMISGMLAGLQGLSASVFSIDGNIDMANKQPNINAIDAILTLSARNPQNFLMMVSNFIPPLTSLQIPSDGTAIDFPIPLPIPLADTPKIAVISNHIVVYIGEIARQHAEKLTHAPLEQNGLFSLNIDYDEYLKLLSLEATKEAKNPEEEERLRDMLKAVDSMETQMHQLIDVSNDGIIFETNAIIN